MATITPRPYHSRRPSIRRSFSSTTIPSSPHAGSPRTACPKDVDAFSYDPQHLAAWYMPQDLWEMLPANLRKQLAAVQHAGAAVLTGFARLEDLRREMASAEVTIFDDANHNAPEREAGHSDFYFESDCSSSSTTTTTSSSSSPMLMQSPMTPSTPITPLSLTLPSLKSPDQERRLSQHSLPPPSPQHAYFTAELSYLRTDALPRLRHAARRVDTEWGECRRHSRAITKDIAGVKDVFEGWWHGKKGYVKDLDERGKMAEWRWRSMSRGSAEEAEEQMD